MRRRIRETFKRYFGRSKNKKQNRSGCFSRNLRCEPLEDRCLLSIGGGWNAALSSWVPQVASTWAQSLISGSQLTQEPCEITWEGNQIEVMPDQWIVQLTPGSGQAAGSVAGAANFLQDNPFDAQVVQGLGMEGLVLVKTQSNTNIATVENYFANNASVVYFEPNSVTRAVDSVLPNDPDFNKSWGLNNTSTNPIGKKNFDADIDAPGAWGTSTGSSNVVVAVIDSGVDYNHPDLVANMWTNLSELNGKPGIDDDGNGYIDDVHGYDFVNNDGDPMDDFFHGTHVAGIIAAQGNNLFGSTGVNWHSSIMALKFLNSTGGGELIAMESAAVSSINYVTAMKEQFGVNVRVINASWSYPDSNAIKSAIEATKDAGILFVFSANNYRGVDDNLNNDDPTNKYRYPSSYDFDNIISVAATDSNDRLASSSHYGATSVDLAAPGVHIYSTLPTQQTAAMSSNGFSSYYGYLGGTSMAAPHVAGVAALLWSIDPNATYSEIRDAIFAGVDPIASLNGKMVTGGRLNALGAVNNLHNFTVTSSNPSDGYVWTTTPLPKDFTVNFSQAYDANTVQASDFTVNTHAAASFTWNTDKSIIFHFDASPVTSQGRQTMAIAGDAISRASGGGILPWQSTFYYDSPDYFEVSNIQVSTDGTNFNNFTDGDSFTTTPKQFIFTFNENIASGSIGTDDLFFNAGRVTTLFRLAIMALNIQLKMCRAISRLLPEIISQIISHFKKEASAAI